MLAHSQECPSLVTSSWKYGRVSVSSFKCEMKMQSPDVKQQGMSQCFNAGRTAVGTTNGNQSQTFQ